MSTPDRFLRTLDAPPGGWQRLIRRRDADSGSWLMPLASLTCAVAVMVFVAPWLHQRPIQLNLNAARLVGERSKGVPLQLLDGRKPVALSSSDPNVRLFWVEPGNEAGSDASAAGETRPGKLP
jgi:hypothetical protein